MLKIIKDKRLRIIVILFLIVIVFIFLKLLSSSEKIVSEPLITPTPTLNIIVTTTPKPTSEGVGTPNFYEKVRPDILKNYPLFDFIPYKTENYKIDYLDPLSLEVILKKDTPKIRQEVLDWISSKGVDSNTHKIIWKTP